MPRKSVFPVGHGSDPLVPTGFPFFEVVYCFKTSSPKGDYEVGSLTSRCLLKRAARRFSAL